MMARMTGVWRRNWRRAAVLLVALVVLIVATRTISGWWIGRQLGEEVARLEKSYGGLNVRSINPPLVPEPKNRARVMRAAAELTVVDRTKGSWVIHGWSPMMDCLSGGDCPAPATGAMRQFVEQNRLAVYVATQGRTLPEATWELNYFRAVTTHMPRNVFQLNMLLGSACRVELEDGHLDRAVEVALTGLAEASSMRNEWARLMQFDRMNAVHQQAGCVREMLQRAEPSAQALSDVAAALADSRWPDPTRMGLIGELKIANVWFIELERGRAVEYPWATSLGSAGPINWLLRPIVAQRRLGDLRALDRFIQLQALAPYQRDAAHTLPAPSPEEQRKAREWGLTRSAVLKVLRTTFVTQWLPNEIDIGWEFHSVLNAAETSVALRRYRLDVGSYPDALPQLVPKYLPWVPIDPFTGRPLEYAKHGAGFELHAQRAKDPTRGYGQALFDWRIPR
jgi:hypothetical protein